MTLRILILALAALALPAAAFAQEDYAFQRDITAGKTDPDSRNNHFINPATTAQERATQRAADQKVPVKPVPEHRVILREWHGQEVPTDVYLIPPSEEERENTLR